MRTRPTIKVLLSAPVVAPGESLLAEAVVEASTETPVDHISMLLEGKVTAAVGAGQHRHTHSSTFLTLEWKSERLVLSPGEHRYRTRYDLPENLPPSYTTPDSSIVYTLTVRASIPWWPDRVETFTIPVGLPPVTQMREARPALVSTSKDGPRGTLPCMELALDSTDLAVGDVLGGSVSVENLRGKQLRGIELAFVEMEHLRAPLVTTREVGRYSLRIYDGHPEEKRAIPFRVRVPTGARPSFDAGMIKLATLLEVRAIVAWGHDLRLGTYLELKPQALVPRTEQGWIAPVGTARRDALWQDVAARRGLVYDPENGTMVGTRGHVPIVVSAEPRGSDTWLFASLEWPSLGLELSVSDRKWSDALALDLVPCGVERIDTRLAVHAREHAQAAPVTTAAFLEPFLAFDEVRIHDCGAAVGKPGSTYDERTIAAFVDAVFHAADAGAAALARVGPPRLFSAEDTMRWRACAERLRGRLDVGDMWIRDGQMQTDRISLGCVWSRNGLLLGATIHVAIDPALPELPTSLEAPEISAAARGHWRELVEKASSVRVESGEIVVDVEGKVADPSTLLPLVDLAVALRRSLAGVTGAGPFR